MSKQHLRRSSVFAIGASLVALSLGCGAASAQSESIKIGVLAPLTGPLATPGKDMVDGFKLFWEQVQHRRRPQGRVRDRGYDLQSRPGASPRRGAWCIRRRCNS